MYKQQIYQIGESNRIEKIDSVARIESNRIETFWPELECSSLLQCRSNGVDRVVKVQGAPECGAPEFQAKI